MNGVLDRVFNLKNGEAQRLGPAAAFQLSFVAGTAVLKAAANALVVARFEAHTLPWLYIAAAVLTSVLAALDGTLRRTTAPPRLSMAVCAVLTLGFAAGAWHGWLPSVVGLYLFAEAYATVASVRFWASLGEAFDARESKRLFGIVGGFGMAGSIVGGLLVGGTAAVIGASLTLVFSALSMAGCAFWGQRLGGALADWHAHARVRAGGRTITGVMLASGAEVRSKPVLYPRGDAWAFFREERYPRALALLSALFAVLTVTADFLFRVSAKGQMSEAQLTALFGSINLVMGLVAMVFQLFLSGRVLSRFGIFRYLLLAPVSTAALAVVSAAAPGLWPAFSLKVAETVGSLSITPTGMQLLYGPLPDNVRVPARAFVDGLVKKSGAALGGVALVALSAVLAPRVEAGQAWTVWLRELSLAVGAVSLAVVAVLSGMKRLYVTTIERRLERARWGEAIAVDAEARAVLLKRLEEQDPARVLMAAELLLGGGGAAATFGPWVRVLLAHPSERVRQRGVQLAAEMKLVELVPKLRAMLQNDERRPRHEAAVALASLDPDAPGVLTPLLVAGDPGVRCSAIAALIKLELERGVSDGPAAKAIEEMLAAPALPVGERRELARLLGRLGGTRYSRRIDNLLDDPDDSVRRLAIASAGECERVDLAPRLLSLLADRDVRRATREALASMGDRIADLLEDALNDRELPAAVRYEIPRLLRYLGTTRAAQIMLFSNIGDDPFLRYRIALALSRMRVAHPDLAFDRVRVEEAIGRRIEAYLYYLPMYRDLGLALPPGAILVRALEARLDQNFEVIFRLLGLVYPYKSLMNVYHRFVEPDPRVRAYAVELFENLVDEEMRDRIGPLLERYHRQPDERAEGDLSRAPARLLELIVSKDTMLRACAISTARRVAPEAAALRIPEEGSMTETVVEKVFLLEAIDIFHGCNVDDLSALGAIAQERRYRQGELVFRAKDPGEALFVIVEGRVHIEKDGQTLLKLEAKHAFGETSLLDGEPRPADARAVTDVHLLAVDRQDFLDLVSDRPELLKGLFRSVSHHLRVVLEAAAAGRLSAPKAYTGT